MNKFLGVLMIMIALFAFNTVFVMAAENATAPSDLDVLNTTRRLITYDAETEAGMAGNLTELDINQTQVSTGWQGYYGNVSGEIVLDDALGNSMYVWDLEGQGGEIFATTDSDGITWSKNNIICANTTVIATEESTMNFNTMGTQDVDGINETFNETSHPAFNISNFGFIADRCNFSTYTYVDDAPDATGTFKETLLYSKIDTSLIYMAFLVAGGADGFKNNNLNYDFQMLVAEDGHNGDNSETAYYFYVELG